MNITTTQKVIKIGTSQGVTLPAKELKALDVQPGDELEVTVRKKVAHASDAKVNEVASRLLERYKQDFTNLSQR